MRFLSSIITGITIFASSWLGLPHHQLQYASATSTTLTNPAASSSKIIYLTFDMDMDRSMYQKTEGTGKAWYNPALFRYLEQNNIPATFFVSGLFAVAYPDLIRTLASTSDFAFENHSYDESSFVPHCYWLKTLTTDQQKTDQIQQTESIIKEDTGQTATYFRFPGDCTNPQNDALVKSFGYTINDGTDISGDPFNKNTEAIVLATLSNARNGATILMHIGGPNAPEDFSVLKQIVPKLELEGYQFAKL